MDEQISGMIRDIVGKRLRSYREESGLSLRDLAAITDIGHSWLGKLENGKINFQIDSLTKLLKYLQVQPSELFKFDLPYSEE
jgi:transcriptional regulator with XRE-family HTH domain